MILFYIIKFIELIKLFLFIYIIFGWIDILSDSSVYDMLRRIFEPMLRPFRSVLSLGYIDFSPILLYFTLDIIRVIIVRLWFLF